MTNACQKSDDRQPTLLVVTTVADTLVAFLESHAHRALAKGWRVHGAANLQRPGRSPVGWSSLHHIDMARGITKPWRLIRAGLAIRSLCAELRPDIVHFHTPIAAAVGRIALGIGKLEPTPLVFYTAHGFHAHPNGSKLGNAAAIFVERSMRRFTDHLVVLNAYDHELATRSLGYDASSTTLVHGIGVDLDHYQSSPDLKQTARSIATSCHVHQDRDFVVAFIGELSKNKRPLDLVEAIERLAAPNLVALFAGRGPLSEEIERAHERGSRVHVLGQLPDVRPLLELADLVVSCSRREGLPRSLLEAIAYERPILVSTARGSVDLARERDAIFEVGNVAQLMERLDSFLTDDRLCSDVGTAQRAHLKHFALANVFDATMELYSDALSTRR